MKKFMIIIMTLLLSMSIASAAFAADTKQSSTIHFDNVYNQSYGTHGHYWSGDINARDWYGYDRHYYYYPNHRYPHAITYHRDGQYYFYKDSIGKLHYFYLNDDWDYDWYSYKDRNGVTQYYYRVSGWK